MVLAPYIPFTSSFSRTAEHLPIGDRGRGAAPLGARVGILSLPPSPPPGPSLASLEWLF